MSTVAAAPTLGFPRTAPTTSDAARPRARFRILGPLDVCDDAGVVPLGGPKPRAVLAVLLLHANEPVTSERLAIALWGEDAPGEAVKAVQVHMSRLRKALGEAAVVSTTAGGYRLRVEPGELDSHRFDELMEAGRAALADGEPERASTLLRAALALWRGPALADFVDEPFAAGEIARLEDRRLAALELRLGAELACGHEDALVAELKGLVSAHPGRERLASLLMTALYRCGRQVEALDVYAQARSALVEQLGVEPGPELTRLQLAILRQDASLEAPAWPTPRSAALRLVDPSDGIAGCPFKGLAAFEAEDAELFFGRDRLVRRLTDALSRAALLAVVGPSGCGKSSLVRAGLLPAIARERVPALIRPGEHPLLELRGAMAVGEDRPVVLVVDQFEEVFSHCVDEAERAAFIDELVTAARDGRCSVVLTLRADYYGRCAAYPELAELAAANHVLVGPMRRDELRDAVEGPSRRAGLELDAGLADALAHDVDGEPGALPLLSTALLELWNQRDGRRLTRAAYERSGGVRGAVARLAEEAFGRLSEQQREIAPGILLRLVDEGPAGRVERRRAPLRDFELLGGKDVASILALFTDRRLLTVGSGTVELAHEALLREWPRLSEWIDRDRDGLRIRRGLGTAAQGWLLVDKDRGALYRGAQLAVASEWANDHGDRLGVVQREFLAASQACERAELEAERRRTRRLRTLATGLAALAAIVSALAFLALDQRGDAQRERTRALLEADESRSLALSSAATANLAKRPDVSLLLALEANRASPRAEARSAAITALTAAFDPGVAGILHGHTEEVAAVDVARDGRTVASAGSDGTVRLWDARTHKQVGAPLRGHSGHVTDVAFSPDGRMLVSSSWDGTIRFWDVRTHAQLGARNSFVSAVAFSRDGRTVAAGQDGTIRLWDARTRLPLGAPLRGHRGAVLDVTFSRDGRTLASTGGDRTIRLWDVRSRHPLGAPLRPHSVARGVAFDRDGRTLAAGSADGRVRFWDVATRKRRGAALIAGRDWINALAFSRDGRRLATAGGDGTIRLWDARTRLPVGAPLTGHAGKVLDVAFGRDGRTLVSAGADTTLRVWRAHGRRRFGATLPGRVGDAMRVGFSSDGETLTVESVPGTPGRRGDDLRPMWRSWDLRSRKQLAPGGAAARAGAAVGRSPAPTWTRNGLVRSPDGRTIATAALGGSTIRLRDARTGKQIGTPMTGHSAPISDLVWSPDGRMVASVSADKTLRVWDVSTQRQIGAPMRAPFDSVTELRFSPDGRTLASAGDEKVIRLWDVRTQKPLGSPLTGHEDLLSGVAFAPDGRTLASVAGGDHAIRLWDVRSQRQLGPPLMIATRYVFDLAFSPDGRTLTAGGVNKVQVWERLLWKTPAELQATICRLVGSGLSRAEWTQHAPGIGYRPSCP